MLVTKENKEKVKDIIKGCTYNRFHLTTNSRNWDFYVDKENLLNYLDAYYGFYISAVELDEKIKGVQNA